MRPRSAVGDLAADERRRAPPSRPPRRGGRRRPRSRRAGGRPALGHVEAAVAGEAGQQRVGESRARAASPRVETWSTVVLRARTLGLACNDNNQPLRPCCQQSDYVCDLIREPDRQVQGLGPILGGAQRLSKDDQSGTAARTSREAFAAPWSILATPTCQPSSSGWGVGVSNDGSRSGRCGAQPWANARTPRGQREPNQVSVLQVVVRHGQRASARPAASRPGCGRRIRLDIEGRDAVEAVGRGDRRGSLDEPAASSAGSSSGVNEVRGLRRPGRGR